MTRDRVIVDFHAPEDAKKVEETVKTGYAESAVENILQWMAVEEDLTESYGSLVDEAKDPASRSTYAQLRDESKSNVEELGGLLQTFEALDRGRVKRIELLSSLTGGH